MLNLAYVMHLYLYSCNDNEYKNNGMKSCKKLHESKYETPKFCKLTQNYVIWQPTHTLS